MDETQFFQIIGIDVKETDMETTFIYEEYYYDDSSSSDVTLESYDP